MSWMENRLAAQERLIRGEISCLREHLQTTERWLALADSIDNAPRERDPVLSQHQQRIHAYIEVLQCDLRRVECVHPPGP